MRLSILKDGRYWISQITIEIDGQEKTARTIHSPPSIFHTKRDAKGFNDFVTALVGDRQGEDITPAERTEIMEAHFTMRVLREDKTFYYPFGE